MTRLRRQTTGLSLKNRLLQRGHVRDYPLKIVSRLTGPAPYAIRTFGDPVLKTKCLHVDNIDDKLVRLAQDMITTMYLAPGVGLAGNQVGVQKQIFVYDDGLGDGARVLINPELIATGGEYTYDEGCLSVPELYFPITRPNTVHMKGLDLDGNDVELEVDGFHGRILQHEWDHLQGTLLLSRLDDADRKVAMKKLREQNMRH